MRPPVIFLTALGQPLRDIARQAAQKAFPGAEFAEAPSVAEALRAAAANPRQLVLLGNAAEAEVAAAVQAVDGDELPRWGVVVLGAKSSPLAECVPIEECDGLYLARIFRAALLQHDLLRENLRLRGDLQTLARRLGHDLRSPLNCLQLNCEVVHELMPTDQPILQSQLKTMQKSLVEIDQLIDRFSTIVRAAANPPSSADVAMEKIVASALSRLPNPSARDGTDVQSPPDWPKVHGVPQWLELIWSNLLTNALKHRTAGTPVELGWHEEGESLRFWVANQGSPVPSAQEPRLFTPFDRLHTRSGHGLGLPIVQRLVTLQGGTCGYQRREDERSVFYFTLPAALSLARA